MTKAAIDASSTWDEKKKRKRKKQSSTLFKIYLNDNYKVEIEIHYNYDNNKIFCNFMVCYFIIERDEII